MGYYFSFFGIFNINFFFLYKKLCTTLWSQGNPNKSLMFEFSLGITNAYISCCIPKTSTQNFTQLFSSMKFPFATDIPRQWLAKILVSFTLSPNLLTSLGLMITRSDQKFALTWKSNKAYFVSSSDFQIVAFMRNASIFN